MMACKISERDFYGALNIAERLELFGIKISLGELGHFCNGVIFLMRKKAEEALSELLETFSILERVKQSELNAPIR